MDKSVDLSDAIEQLRPLNEPVPLPLRLPTEAEVRAAEEALGQSFQPDYRRFLLEASDVVFGTLEPCLVTVDAGYRDLVPTAQDAWDLGVPREWLPICEDNSDYYCLDETRVRFWSHDGATDESWPDLATWIIEVWIGGG